MLAVRLDSTELVEGQWVWRSWVFFSSRLDACGQMWCSY